MVKVLELLSPHWTNKNVTKLGWLVFDTVVNVTICCSLNHYVLAHCLVSLPFKNKRLPFSFKMVTMKWAGVEGRQGWYSKQFNVINKISSLYI